MEYVELVDDDPDEDDTSSQIPKMKPRAQKALTLSETLLLICKAVLEKEVPLTWDHFRLHRSAWRVLRAIKEENDDDSKRIYGPGYLKEENQFPFIADYIFQAAMKTNTAGQMLQGSNQDGLVVQPKALMLAAATLESMIDTGMAVLEIKILRDKYGIGIEIEWTITTLAWPLERKGHVESILKVTL